jgi:hypothetical protein
VSAAFASNVAETPIKAAMNAEIVTKRNFDMLAPSASSLYRKFAKAKLYKAQPMTGLHWVVQVEC